MIWHANERGVRLTSLRLQKLLYLLYTKYYYDTKDALFYERFVAWRYGPALFSIYSVFKGEGADPIIKCRPDANGNRLMCSVVGDFAELFDYIWGNYAYKSAKYLVGLTRGEETPGYETAWRKAYKNGEGEGGFLADQDILEDGELWFAPGSN